MEPLSALLIPAQHQQRASNNNEKARLDGRAFFILIRRRLRGLVLELLGLGRLRAARGSGEALFDELEGLGLGDLVHN